MAPRSPRQHDAPSSSAAPLRENDIGLVAPDDDDDGPSLPEVRIAGFKVTSIVLFIVVVAGAFFGLRALIHYATDEVTRSNSEIHDKLSPR